MFRQRPLIRDSSERDMSENLSVPIQTQLETNLNQDTTTNPSFTICAPGTASPFIKAAEAYMVKNKKEDLTIYLSTVGDCIKISFK